MKRILIIVGMVESSHFQKWIKATISTELFSKVIVIPSDYPANKINSNGLGLEGKQRSQLKVFKLPIGSKLNNFTFRILDLIFGLNWRAFILFIFIKIYKPIIIHFQELQHGGYIYNAKIFKSKGKRKYKVICSTWGSDLILYGKLASHELPLKQLLSNTDVLTAERVDDEAVARKLNYSNLFLAPLYITVGAKVDTKILLSKPSDRKMILIKGYQDNHGRALNALAALSLIEEHLIGYKIGVFSASTAVALQVDYLQNNSSLDIEIIKRTSNEEIKNYFSLSRVYIGLAVSDGLSTSMVEAMEQGTFPIQSENSAASSFIKNGITGYIVDPWDITGVANCIEKAVKDDQMVDTAAVENLNSLEKKYSYESGLSQIRELYKT
jgi:glycosyltransferase involved in cell wall biosynthesis